MERSGEYETEFKPKIRNDGMLNWSILGLKMRVLKHGMIKIKH